MQKITVRSATTDDIPRLAEIWLEKNAMQQQFDRRTRVLPHGQQQWCDAVQNWLEEPRCAVFVAEMSLSDDKQVVGYVIGWIEDNTPGLEPETFGLVSDIGIDAHIPQGGVGRALIDPMRAWFASQSVEHIVARVPRRQAVEQAFWRASGAVEWVDLMWMTL